MRVLARFCLPFVALMLPCGGLSLAAEPDIHAMPTLSAVKSTVKRHFAGRRDFKKGDLITRDQVAPVLAQLESLGWAPADRKEILAGVPAPGEFLAVELRRSKQGVAFMRQIGGLPSAYDRLDRLARLPHGVQTIHDMIYKPGGAELIRYMTTSKGGDELGKMLAHTPEGRRFNEPTGRIYTVEQLIARLTDSYRRATEPPPEPPPSGR